MIEKLKIRSEHISQNILIQFLIYLCLFLITLSSFYSFKFSLNFFFIFSFCLSSLFVLINLKKYFLVVKNSKLILFFYIVPFFLSLISCYYYSIEIRTIFYLKFAFILFLGLNIYFLSSIINLKNLISFFLIIHASFFLIEFFSYYIFKYQISFYELFWQGGEGVAGPHLESENLKYWWNYIRIKRFTGLFNEPGTYSCIISILVFSLMIQKKLSYRYWLIILISTVTLLLSSSLRGIIFFLLIISFVIFLEKKNLFKIILKNKILFLIIILAISVYSYFYLFNYLVARFAPHFLTEQEIILRNLQFNRTNLNFYVEAILRYKDLINKDIIFLLIGYGYGNEEFAYKSSEIFNETGLYLYVLSRSGILYSIIICLLILREIKSKSHTFLCLLLLSLSKLSFFNPIFLILIAAIKKKSFEN